MQNDELHATQMQLLEFKLQCYEREFKCNAESSNLQCKLADILLLQKWDSGFQGKHYEVLGIRVRVSGDEWMNDAKLAE